MSAEKEFFRVEYNNRLDNDGDECIVPTVWFGSQGFDLVRQYDQGEESALEHAKWYVSMFEKAMESYAREYHAKEMEKALEEAEKKIENLPLGKDSRSYHGATWL